MKYAVSIYSFMQYVWAGKMNPVDCIVKAKEMGFDGIEIVDCIFGNENDIELAKELRAKADDVGIEIPNLAVGGELLVEGTVEKFKHFVDVAEILGTSYMRHDAGGDWMLEKYESYDSALGRLADSCREITEYAVAKGIKTMTENHGQFSQDSLRIEKLVSAVAHKNFGHLLDIGNFMCADEDPAVAVSRCGKYAFFVHAKDFIVKDGNGVSPGDGFFMSRGGNFLRGTIIGHGDVPVVRCLRSLKSHGYDGWLSVEFEGMEDCLEGIRIGYSNLRRFWESV